MQGRRIAGLALALAMAAGITVDGPARADGGTLAECHFEATLEQSYGLTLQPSRSTFRTPEPGWIECHGTIDGVEVDARGTMTFVGATENTWCGAGDGWVKAKASLPVDGREMKLKVSGEWHRVGLVMSITGETNGHATAGAITAQRLDGNCDVDNPLTAEDEGEPVRRVTLRGVVAITD